MTYSKCLIKVKSDDTNNKKKIEDYSLYDESSHLPHDRLWLKVAKELKWKSLILHEFILLLLIIPNGTSELERIFSFVKNANKKRSRSKPKKIGIPVDDILLFSKRRKLQQAGTFALLQEKIQNLGKDICWCRWDYWIIIPCLILNLKCTLTRTCQKSFSQYKVNETFLNKNEEKFS